MMYVNTKDNKYVWYVGEPFPLSIREIDELKSIQCDSDELSIFRQSYPSFIGNSTVNFFYGDMAKMMIMNTKITINAILQENSGHRNGKK